MYRVLLSTVFELLLFGKIVVIAIQSDTVSSYNDDDVAFKVSKPADKGQFCQRARI